MSAFWRSDPIERFISLLILATGVRAFEWARSALTSCLVNKRRAADFFDFFAIRPQVLRESKRAWFLWRSQVRRQQFSWRTQKLFPKVAEISHLGVPLESLRPVHQKSDMRQTQPAGLNSASSNEPHSDQSLLDWRDFHPKLWPVNNGSRSFVVANQPLGLIPNDEARKFLWDSLLVSAYPRAAKRPTLDHHF